MSWDDEEEIEEDSFRPIPDLTPKDYSRFWLKVSTLLVSRVMYKVQFGIDSGPNLVMHTCDNLPCVNSNHLVLETYSDNLRDYYKKRRH